ncbi:MAG TPA: DegV family protein [Candidatus Baltobacteraceae bacterium]|nr:DegV family protein [Candidatus Baltobacteraceae bacterium]
MAVVIVTDSGCDLTLDEARSLGVEIVPVWIVIGDTKYRDCVDLEIARFFALTESSEALPKTESPQVEQFAETFQRLTAAGNSVVAILLSSRISQSVANATTAAAPFGDRVRIVDSLSSAGVEYLLVARALELARGGATAATIADSLDPGKMKSVAFFTGPNVGNLGRTGRVAQSVAALSQTLHVYVVLKMNENGAIVPAGQSRDEPHALEIMVDSALRALRGSREMRFCVSHARAPEAARAAAELLRAREPAASEVPIREYTATIALHQGVGAVGIYGIAP